MKTHLIFLLILLCISRVAAQDDVLQKLVKEAVKLTEQRVVYDPSYFRIPYPNGDIPADKGVCTDVVIRAYRKIGIDLQQKVHEDMKGNFAKYPKLWGLSKPDTNMRTKFDDFFFAIWDFVANPERCKGI
jgi:uncharacterized protein YijF (DUF1287 family)